MMAKKILLIFLVILVIIQFFHPKKNISTGPHSNNIATLYAVPRDVVAVLSKACLDCHSDNTRYRWYFKIQPVDWWLTDHIRSGKEALNFDEFAGKSIGYQYHKLRGIMDQVKKGSMPLNSYLWIHKDAMLTAQEKDAIIHWAQAIVTAIQAKYPADSLSKKKE